MPAEAKLAKYLTQFEVKNASSNALQEDPYSSRKGSLYYVSELVKAVAFEPDKLKLANDHIYQTLDYLSMLK